jgi:hypothetical protein
MTSKLLKAGCQMADRSARHVERAQAWRGYGAAPHESEDRKPKTADELDQLTWRFQTRRMTGRQGAMPDTAKAAVLLSDPKYDLGRRVELAGAMIDGMTTFELSNLPTGQQQPLVELMKDQGFESGGPRETLLRAIGNDREGLSAEAPMITRYADRVRTDPELAAARRDWDQLSTDKRWQAIERIADIHAETFGYQRPQMVAFEKPRVPYGDGRFIYEYGEYQSPAMGGPPEGAVRFNRDADHLREFDRSFTHMTHELTHARDVAKNREMAAGRLNRNSAEGKQLGRMQADFAEGFANRTQKLMAGRIPYEFQATEQHAVIVAHAAASRLDKPDHDVKASLLAVFDRPDDPGAAPAPLIRKLPAGVKIDRGFLSVTAERVDDWRQGRKREAAPSAPRPS